MFKKITTALISAALMLAPATTFAHGNHNHSHTHKQPHQEGIFEDSQVQDRMLTDWTGDWQSVYPYMQSGELDMVMRHKATDSNATKTFDEYKQYYLTGYKSDIDRITINGDTGEFSFYYPDQTVTATYQYDGFKILTYPSGKKGVRYLFSTMDNKAPRYLQFSDHEISPTISHHFHIFLGNDSHEKLFDELENWPTFYPSDLDIYEIIDEMIAH